MIDSLDIDNTLRKIVVQYVTDELDENGRWNIQASIKDFAKCIFKEDFMQRSNEERDTISDYTKVRQFRTEMKRLMEEAAEELKAQAGSMLGDVQRTCTPELAPNISDLLAELV